MVDIIIHQGLVKKLARKYARNEDELDELISEGNIVLVVAGTKYDESKGVKFSTYAYYCVKHCMLNYIRDSDLGKDENDLPISLVEYEDTKSYMPFNKGVDDGILCEQLFEMAQLEEKEISILEMQYWDGMSQSEIAKVLGLTQQRIEQMAESALLKLRKVCRRG